jgi:hypothetical protein
MKTASEIIDFIGRERLAAALGVTTDAVDRARRNNQLPSLWYHACEEMAGRPLPREAFSFKPLRKAS